MHTILYYMLAINLIGALVCAFDKLSAKNGWRRIPERTLFFWTLVGGGIGVFLSMLLFRHKTLHLSFMIGVPLIIILQLVIFMGIYYISLIGGIL